MKILRIFEFYIKNKLMLNGVWDCIWDQFIEAFRFYDFEFLEKNLRCRSGINVSRIFLYLEFFNYYF